MLKEILKDIIQPMLKPMIEPILADLLLEEKPKVITDYIIRPKKEKEKTAYDIMHLPICTSVRFAIKFTDTNGMAVTDVVKGEPDVFFENLKEYAQDIRTDIKYIESLSLYARYRYKGKSDSAYHGFTKYGELYGPEALLQAIDDLQNYAAKHPEIFL